MTNPAATNGGLGGSVVDEVRAIRAKIDAEAGHDIRKLAEQARQVSEAVRREYGTNVAETDSQGQRELIRLIPSTPILRPTREPNGFSVGWRTEIKCVSLAPRKLGKGGRLPMEE